MILYKKKAVSIFKFIIALIVFILAITITFDDVYGLNVQGSSDKAYKNSLREKQDSSNEESINNSGDTNDEHHTGLSTETGTEPHNESLPTSVPEPATLVLLASGLGIIGFATRKKS